MKLDGLRHRGCGGKVREDWSVRYYDEDGVHYGLCCVECGKELLGDWEIEAPPEVEEQYRGDS